MARIRTIKPEFWIDERVGECSPTARLLFIATWNFADDNGNLERSAKQLKAQAMPYDDVDCEALLVELIHLGLLREYVANGHMYLHISGFEKHQKIEKKSAARHPLPDSSPTTTQPVGSVREGKGREKEGKGEGKMPPTPEQQKSFDERDYRKLCTARTELLRTEKSEMGTRLVYSWVENMTEDAINELAAKQAGIAPWRLTELLERVEPKKAEA